MIFSLMAMMIWCDSVLYRKEQMKAVMEALKRHDTRHLNSVSMRGAKLSSSGMVPQDRLSDEWWWATWEYAANTSINTCSHDRAEKIAQMGKANPNYRTRYPYHDNDQVRMKGVRILIGKPWPTSDFSNFGLHGPEPDLSVLCDWLADNPQIRYCNEPSWWAIIHNELWVVNAGHWIYVTLASPKRGWVNCWLTSNKT